MNSAELIQDTPEPIEQAPPLKGVAKKIAAANKKLEEAKESHGREIALLLKMASVIDKLPDDIAEKADIYCGLQLDFNNLTREQSLIVISTLRAGKWQKSVNGENIDYETQIDGVTVRLWAAGPPDSCRVIEVEEIVPATTITRRRLVCSDKGEL
jgi:hypothetical protein